MNLTNHSKGWENGAKKVGSRRQNDGENREKLLKANS